MKKTRIWLILAIVAIVGIAAFFYLSNKEKEDSLKSIRNNWSVYIFTPKYQYKYNKLGGIEAFDIPVENNTDYVLDEVIITVEYIKQAGGTFKTENVTINNIQPHSTKAGRAPDSPRGTSVTSKIKEVMSRSLHFCYPSGSGNFSDPYYCK